MTEVEETVEELVSTPWKDGYWVPKIEGTHFVHEVKGNVSTFKNLAQMDFPDMPDKEMQQGKWTFGDFGEAHEELQEMTGKSNYNFQMSYFEDSWIQKGIVMDNNQIFFMNTSGELDTLQCLTEDELKSLLQNRESLEERSHFYKVQPENQGRLIFLSGTPGSGKSSVALKLAQKEGFVYYEGDCFGNFTNPYIPLHVSEPSTASVKQKPVKVSEFQNESIGSKSSTLF